jgi:hypothetical protein
MKTPRETLAAMGHEAQQVLGRGLSQEILCGRFCDELEEKLRMRAI